MLRNGEEGYTISQRFSVRLKWKEILGKKKSVASTVKFFPNNIYLIKYRSNN